MKKVCLLTGAGGKLGTAFCRLHADKYHIVGVYRKRQPEVASQLQRFVNPLSPETALAENEHPIYAVQAELTDDRELERVVELTLARYDRIDLLVNAAVHYLMSPILDSNRLVEQADTHFNTNVIIPLKLATQVARMFWRDREEENLKFNRNVINVSSLSGLRVYRNSGQSLYSASKAALNYLTYHLADEFKAIGVRVNATAPNSFPRIVSTESVVQTIFRLDCGLMNGKILVLDSDGVRFV